MAYTALVRLEWDEVKNLANQENHGISFEEAGELLTGDQDSLEIYDELHSDAEDRFITIGPIRRGLIMVVWAERAEGVLRIISARWTTKRETDLYRAYLEEQL
jgi:hypothetical protein